MKKLKKTEIKRDYWLIDAKDKILGRLATSVADLLRGKNKSIFLPYQDVGDYVVIINAKDIKTTGKKMEQKIYYHHTGYPGGLKKKSLKDLFQKRPTEVLRKAVSGMLPKNKLKKFWLKRLLIYEGPEYPYKEKVKKYHV